MSINRRVHLAYATGMGAVLVALASRGALPDIPALRMLAGIAMAIVSLYIIELLAGPHPGSDR